MGVATRNVDLKHHNSQVRSDSIPISGSPQLESTNDSQPIKIDDDEEEDVIVGSKRKLKTVV